MSLGCACGQLSFILSESHDLVRIKESTFIQTLTTFALKDAVSEVVDTLEVEFKRRSTEVVVNFDDESILCDRRVFQQIFINALRIANIGAI